MGAAGVAAMTDTVAKRHRIFCPGEPFDIAPAGSVEVIGPYTPSAHPPFVLWRCRLCRWFKWKALP